MCEGGGDTSYDSGDDSGDGGGDGERVMVMMVVQSICFMFIYSHSHTAS